MKAGGSKRAIFEIGVEMSGEGPAVRRWVFPRSGLAGPGRGAAVAGSMTFQASRL